MKTVAIVGVAAVVVAASYLYTVRAGEALLSRAEVEALERIPVLSED